MKKYNLAEALLIIAQNNFCDPSLITSICFEDGSQRSFCYSMITGNYYCRLSDYGTIIRNTFREPKANEAHIYSNYRG